MPYYLIWERRRYDKRTVPRYRRWRYLRAIWKRGRELDLSRWHLIRSMWHTLWA